MFKTQNNLYIQSYCGNEVLVFASLFFQVAFSPLRLIALFLVFPTILKDRHDFIIKWFRHIYSGFLIIKTNYPKPHDGLQKVHQSPPETVLQSLLVKFWKPAGYQLKIIILGNYFCCINSCKFNVGRFAHVLYETGEHLLYFWLCYLIAVWISVTITQKPFQGPIFEKSSFSKLIF